MRIPTLLVAASFACSLPAPAQEHGELREEIRRIVREEVRAAVREAMQEMSRPVVVRDADARPRTARAPESPKAAEAPKAIEATRAARTPRADDRDPVRSIEIELDALERQLDEMQQAIRTKMQGQRHLPVRREAPEAQPTRVMPRIFIHRKGDGDGQGVLVWPAPVEGAGRPGVRVIRIDEAQERGDDKRS